MTTWLPRWIACLVLVFPFISVIVADPDNTEIARVVKQLGHDEFEKREDATARLKEIGEPALDVLHKAKTSSDREVRRRAEDIVAVVEDKLYVEQLCLTGHSNQVWTVSVSADGKRLLTCSLDKTLRLWDATTGKQLRVFEGHTESILAAALSPDGKRALSGGIGKDGSVRLWDVATGKELYQMTGDADAVRSVAFGPEGKAISGHLHWTLQVWDLNTGRNAGILTGHTDQLYRVAYSDKAKLTATCSNDQSIRLWNLETGKEVRTLPSSSPIGFGSVCFSPDGKRLLAVGSDATLRLWEVETGKELQRLKAKACCAGFSPNGKRIVLGGYLDETVRIWDIESDKELRRYEGHTSFVTSVVFFPDGKRIASASGDNTARIWRAPR